MTNPTPDITACGVANPSGSPCTRARGHAGGHDLVAYGPTPDIPILDDDAIARIECESEMASPKDVRALCATVRALRAKYDSLKAKIAWHRDGVGPDVPVLQERYDKLIGQRNDLQSQLERLTKERDDLQVHVEERDSLLSAAPDPATSMCSACVDAVREIEIVHADACAGPSDCSCGAENARQQIYFALELVSIQEQGAQHEHDWYNDGSVLRCYDCTETKEAKQ